MQLRKSVKQRIRTGAVVLAGAWLAATAGASHRRGRTHPFQVKGGILTIDGMTARHGLTMRTANLHYLYLYLPGEGTAIVSPQPFEGAHPQTTAFRGDVLTISAGGHRVELTSTTPVHSHTAYVRFEHGVITDLRTPALAFGDTTVIPAVWPVEEGPAATGHLRVKVRGRRALRSGKLCRPSPRGRELCAVVREVVYKPW